MRMVFLLLTLSFVACAAPREARDVFNTIEGSTVIVETQRTTGSGTIVYSRGGSVLVLTCAHVVVNQPVDKLSVRLFGILIPAYLERMDEDVDLALLAFKVGVDVPPLRLAPLEPVRFEKLYLLGAPLHMGGTAMEAILTRKDLSWNDNPLWQLTTTIMLPGISGGTAVNIAGELACVPQSVRTLGDGIVPQIGFCIPLNTVKNFLREYSL